MGGWWVGRYLLFIYYLHFYIYNLNYFLINVFRLSKFLFDLTSKKISFYGQSKKSINQVEHV
jgi:hypothetical protein